MKKKFFKALLYFVIFLGAAAGTHAMGYWDITAVPYNLGILKPKAPIGDVIDSLHGVPVYYNGPVKTVVGRNVAPDGYNLGQKYQCVEFVKRYYYEALKHKMPDSYGHAKDFFTPAIQDGAFNPKRGLLQFTNPSAWQPQVSDLLVFTSFGGYGHVAIVSQVFDDEIELIQQNPGPAEPSRIRIKMLRQDAPDATPVEPPANGTAAAVPPPTPVADPSLAVPGKLWRLDNSRIAGWLRLPLEAPADL